MGLTADTPDFVYQSHETRREREAHEDVSHCVGKDCAIRTRNRSATGRSAASRSTTSSKRSGRRSRASQQGPASRSAKSPRPPSCKGDGRSKEGRSKEGHSKEDRIKSVTADQRPLANVERCYELPPRIKRDKCVKPEPWQNGKYLRDECGSGIVPVRMGFIPSRKKLWCKTPLSMYQATIGELGREILCREKIVARDVKPGPPCNIEAFILPPCRGYYRKYDCLRPCEEMYAYQTGGQKIYRHEVDRYWEPCQMREQNSRGNINDFAGQNVYLGKQLRRKMDSTTCW